MFIGKNDNNIVIVSQTLQKIWNDEIKRKLCLFILIGSMK